MPVSEIKIIKVPLSDREKVPDYPKNFPSMPRLYLELLENKAKIKQDLINKEYVPPERDVEVPLENVPDDRKKKHTLDNREKDRDNNREKDRDNNREKDREKDRDNNREKDRDNTGKSSEAEKDLDKRSLKEDAEITERRGATTTESSRHTESEPEKSDTTDDLSARLKELLGDEDESRTDKYSRNTKQSTESHNSRYTPYDKYEPARAAGPNKYEKPKVPEVKVAPPTLAELEAQGRYQGKPELRDINHIPAGEYEEEDKKRELLFKFELLKKSYPAAASIPDFSVHSELRQMQKEYDSTVRRLSLDSTVDSYKSYLIGGFMLVEFVFGNFLSFDMQGFTQQQIINMHNYEKLLIELGEKSYVPSGSRWPVELRLLGIIVINAGVFIVSKMIMRKTGANLLGMINNMNVSTQAATTQARQKRRMRGPNINLDDIPDAGQADMNRPVMPGQAGENISHRTEDQYSRATEPPRDNPARPEPPQNSTARQGQPGLGRVAPQNQPQQHSHFHRTK